MSVKGAPVPAVWSYEGRRVVVSGGGGAGMGAAVVRQLQELGAEIHVLDLKDPPVEVASHHRVDLREPSSVDAVVQSIGGPIDALFNCAGLPGPPWSDLETMMVNFVATRHLTDVVTERMGPGGAVVSISSAAGASWASNVAKWMPLVTTTSVDEARQWLVEHPEEITSGYAPSKEAIIIWSIWRSFELGKRGIRINCTSPGPTATPMLPAFEEQMGKAFMDNYPIPLGRRSTPDEQAYPLVFLGSPAAAAITGENLMTDGGTMGALAVGTLDASAFFVASP